MKPAFSITRYRRNDWVKNRWWLYDRVRFLLFMQRHCHEVIMDNSMDLLFELDDLRDAHIKIYNMAWEDDFDNGLSYREL